jgi:UDP-N-acetylmuramoyl-L-alanyl-D-glutamate--2,6-diaminopimelate ligase
MKLSELAGAEIPADVEISGLAADSREVRPGYLFAALPGAARDGRDFIPDAERAGAAAILAVPGARTTRPLIADADPRRRLAALAARFYPRQPAGVVGVTGTNGKSSTVRFAAQLWRKRGRKAGSLGTLGAEAPDFHRKLAHTTPEPVTLHRTLDEMARAGVDRLAIEVSSHALAQSRADGVRFAGAAFTNITQDHLDYHADFEEYFETKLRLFAELTPPSGFIAVNADGAGAARVCETARARGLMILTTGSAGETLKLAGAEPSPEGLMIRVAADGRDWRLALPLIGRFQAENALLAAAIVIGSGEAAGDVVPRLESLEGAPGRMQKVASVAGAAVYVDYAHTPDAVATALRAIRPHVEGKLVAIIGAGGDRDRAKRPLMGRAAAAHADAVIVTDDNPRSEDPAAIRRAVVEGAAGALDIADRAEAIARGVAMLGPGDALVVAGKGHETGQTIAGRTLPFDDADVARRAAADRDGRAA